MARLRSAQAVPHGFYYSFFTLHLCLATLMEQFSNICFMSRSFGSELPTWEPAFAMATPDVWHRKPQGDDLEGLADLWDRDETFRRAVVKRRTLCIWPDAKKTGLISYETLQLNVHLMKMMVDFWCPRQSVAKTLPMDNLKWEAGVLCLGNSSCEHTPQVGSPMSLPLSGEGVSCHHWPGNAPFCGAL